jgi:hypothetical protein
MPRKSIYPTLAVATCVAGLIAAPAQAAPRTPFPMAPACLQWRLDSTALDVDLSNGVLIIMGWDQATQKVSSNPDEVELTSPDGGKWHAEQPPIGGMVGADGVDIRIEWKSITGDFEKVHAGSSHLVGKVEPDTTGLRGTLTNEKGESWDFVSHEFFECAKKAEEPKAAEPQTQNNPDQNKPEPEKPQPVTDAIKLSFGPSNGFSITATVTNSSSLKGQCTYDATPSNTHRDFTVPPNGSTDLTFSGLGLGVSYHAVVACKDASGKQSESIGRAETDVTF